MKPSIEYLNSLNEYRKRSRSTEDVGFSTSNSGKKVVKLGYENPGSGPIIASAMPMLEALVKEQPLDVEVTLPQGEDPIVYGMLFITVLTTSLPLLAHFLLVVNGKPMPFSTIAEEHQELMTPEEYTTYFEVYQQLNP